MVNKAIKYAAAILGTIYIAIPVAFHGYHFLKEKGLEVRLWSDAIQTRKLVPKVVSSILKYGKQTGENQWEFVTNPARFDLKGDCLDITIKEYSTQGDLLIEDNKLDGSADALAIRIPLSKLLKSNSVKIDGYGLYLI